MAGLFGSNAEVTIVLDGAESRRQANIKDRDGKILKLPIYQVKST